MGYATINCKKANIDIISIFLIISSLNNLFYELLCDKKLIYKVTKTLIILLIGISVIRIGIYFGKVINSYEYSNLYFGSLLNDDLKEKISFDVILKLESGKTFKSNIKLELPIDNVVENGTQSKEYTDLKEIVFKRINE